MAFTKYINVFSLFRPLPSCVPSPSPRSLCVRLRLLRRHVRLLQHERGAVPLLPEWARLAVVKPQQDSVGKCERTEGFLLLYFIPS